MHLPKMLQMIHQKLNCASGCGSEVAMYAMRLILQHNNADAVILVRASNNFKNLNRDPLLHKI